MTAVRTLTTRDLNRTLLARQHLLERVAMPAIDMIEHLVGMQAQEPRDPYVALWSRLVDFRPTELEGLLLEKRAVRMALMRSTIHLVSTDDALAFRPVVQPALDWELFRNKTWSAGLEGVDLEPVLAYGRELVDERPRSLAELRVAMAERFPGRDATTLAYACRGRLPTFQVPVAVAHQLKVPATQGGAVAMDSLHVPFDLDVERVIAVGGQLWVTLDAHVGEVQGGEEGLGVSVKTKSKKKPAKGAS